MSGIREFFLNQRELGRVQNRKKFLLKKYDQFKHLNIVCSEYGENLMEEWSGSGYWKNDISDLRSTIRSLVTRKFIDEYNIIDFSWINSNKSFRLEMIDGQLLEGYGKSGMFFIDHCRTLKIFRQMLNLAAYIYVHDLETKTLESIRYLFCGE